MASVRTFDDLVAEAEHVLVDGWDFPWLDGRATEERPRWGYTKLLVPRVDGAASLLDLRAPSAWS